MKSRTGGGIIMLMLLGAQIFIVKETRYKLKEVKGKACAIEFESEARKLQYLLQLVLLLYNSSVSLFWVCWFSGTYY